MPALATSWEGSPEGWTFTLNPEAKWEDGTPITAEDVKFSFEATMGMHDFMGATSGGRMKRSIEAIEVRDQQTVFIKTKAPTANFFLDYSGAGYPGFGIVPKHYLMKVGAEGFANRPLGGRPFTVKEWVPGHRIVFERNEAFWGRYPWYTKPQARMMEIIRVREALDIAIDKKTISDKIHGSLSTPTGSVFSLSSFGLRKEVAERVIDDPQRAKQLLHEAGYPQGFSTKLYFAKVRPGLSEYLEAVVAYWHKIGVKADLIEGETSTYWVKIRAPYRAYQPLALWTWGRQDDSSVIIDSSFNKGGSYVGAFNAQTNELHARLMQEWDDHKRAKLIAEIEDIVLDNRRYIPLYNFPIVFGYSPRVVGHPHRPYTSYMFDFWRVALKD